MRAVGLLHLFPVPDWLVRRVIRLILSRSTGQRYRLSVEEQETQRRTLIEKLKQSPIAIRTEDANRQHYEISPAFFRLVLGKWLKYSCCYWPDGTPNIDQAEEAMLSLTCRRARLEDGMRILDLGCGWGSLSLWIAENYPNCSVVATSNSRPQIAAIQERCRERGLGNVQGVVADINDLHIDQNFDRVMSIEMFEHMKNYERLMARIASFLEPQGQLFVHVFSHREFAFEFAADDADDWMAQTFFSGGTMPSDDLLLHFQRDLHVVDHWRISGIHYARTLRAWLDRFDEHRGAIGELFTDIYGPVETARRLVDWRLFFMACEETWALRQGREYLVSHYLFER